jgi:hypothetical protein
MYLIRGLCGNEQQPTNVNECRKIHCHNCVYFDMWSDELHKCTSYLKFLKESDKNMNDAEAFKIVLSHMKPILSKYESEYYNGNLDDVLIDIVSNLRVTVGVLETELDIINGVKK